MKSAFISIVGRPSAGKSTLLNSLCGHKVSIVSPTPQTTRNRIRGVLTRKEGQLVFVDTPGFNVSAKKLNLHMKDLIISSLGEVDVVLYVADLSRTMGEEERAVIERVKSCGSRLVVALNKIDLPGINADERKNLVSRLLPDAGVYAISAAVGTGIEDMIAKLYDLAPEGELMYPEEFYTDQDPEFRVSEIIREKAILRTGQEVPHSLYVEIADMELHESDQILWIRAFIAVERDSQIGILVGKGGSKIKEIRKAALAEIRGLFPYNVELDIRVKVKKDWRKKDHLLNKLIY